jgi:hypothetical protein
MCTVQQYLHTIVENTYSNHHPYYKLDTGHEIREMGHETRDTGHGTRDRRHGT